MITKQSADKNSFKNENAEESRILISGYDLISETKDFLDTYYKGCFESNTVEYITRSLYVSPIAYANFLKIIFKSVFGGELITINIETTAKELIFNINFTTATLTESEKESLLKIADSGGFNVSITERSVIATFSFIAPGFSMFNSISQRIIFNTLKSVFAIGL